MRLVLTGRHLDISPGLRTLVDRKLVRLERLLGNSIVSAQVVCVREKDRLEADVTVRVHITASGQLAQVELVRGADQAAFNEAALAAARKERFSPETHDEKPVETSLTYTYRFRVTP